jgi:hypothetical protein
MKVPKRSSTVRPADDEIVPFSKIARRWNCHSKVAKRRVAQAGLPIVAFNTRAKGVKLSDLLHLEEEAASSK